MDIAKGQSGRRAFKIKDQYVLRAMRGEKGQNFRLLEDELGIKLHSRGFKIRIECGSKDTLDKASDILNQMRQIALRGMPVDEKTMARILHGGSKSGSGSSKPSARGKYMASAATLAKTPIQQEYLEAIDSKDLVFGLGPAGTGKTFLAVARALKALDEGTVSRLVITRPAVEAGESLGFLPGTLADKINPYLQPIFDAINELAGKGRLEQLRASGKLEVAPLAFMRGRTLSNCFVLLDEAQNCTFSQITMLLTRLGPGSKCVVTGDAMQSDLRNGASGLIPVVKSLRSIPEIHVVEFNPRDVVRHKLVAKIVKALGAYNQPQTGSPAPLSSPIECEDCDCGCLDCTCADGGCEDCDCEDVCNNCPCTYCPSAGTGQVCVDCNCCEITDDEEGLVYEEDDEDDSEDEEESD